ncbi:MAG TPA: lipid-binding protein [Puia sp.]|nr:lipid-binding protein [Puia sp.]
MRKILFSIFILLVVLSLSCKKTYVNGKTNAEKAAHGWWITFKENGVDTFGIGTVFLDTYNTSNDDSIWVDDLTNTWQYKVKAKLDYTNLTFSTKGAQNEYYNITVDIMDGKILPKAGRSKSGVATDSINFRVVFSDSPPDTFTVAGTARTGFIQDDY